MIDVHPAGFVIDAGLSGAPDSANASIRLPSTTFAGTLPDIVVLVPLSET
jgi:hypothetical protein